MPIDGKRIEDFAQTVVRLYKEDILGAVENNDKGYTFPVWIGAEENTAVFKGGLKKALKEQLGSLVSQLFGVVCEESKQEEEASSIVRETKKDDTKYYTVSLRRI